MHNQTIDIWDNCNYSPDSGDIQPTLTTYILDFSNEMPFSTKRPAVLVCPGGGYSYTSDREAEPIAMRFVAAGFHTFVLRYRVAPSKHPKPLLDVSRAMWIIRENAELWNVDPEKVAVCGFSAGGHLAGSLGVFWQEDYIKEAMGMPEGMNKPNAMILCYPVISSGQFAHRGSFEKLLGKDASKEMQESMSLEHNVSQHTPKTFLWHTFQDNGVPVENTLLFAQALRREGIPFELHIYPEGPHGMSTSDVETVGKFGVPEGWVYPHVASWLPLCVEWLRGIF
ncbi:MAG: alpha/beta hydrolase [Clostridiales bacterium]|nr:alpha/beta hydrolase [Clostridiales bacterium]